MSTKTKGALAVMDDIAFRLQAVADECSPTYARYMREPAQALADARTVVTGLATAAEALLASPMCAKYRLISPYKDLAAALAKVKGGAA